MSHAEKMVLSQIEQVALTHDFANEARAHDLAGEMTSVVNDRGTRVAVYDEPTYLHGRGRGTS